MESSLHYILKKNRASYWTNMKYFMPVRLLIPINQFNYLNNGLTSRFVMRFDEIYIRIGLREFIQVPLFYAAAEQTT